MMPSRQTMKLMFTFRSVENPKYTYYANVIRDDDRKINGFPSYFWFGDIDNDVDGSPYWEHDKYGQPDTSLHYKGKAVNGDKVPFMVVPPAIIQMVPDVLLGCVGTIEYNNNIVACVVADVSPTKKIGEASPAALRALGLPAPKNGNGGLDEQEAIFRCWPGVPARLEVNGDIYQFELQHS